MELPISKDKLILIVILTTTGLAYVIASVAITVQTAKNVDNVKPKTTGAPTTTKPQDTCQETWAGPNFPDNGLKDIRSSASAADQQAAVMGMIQRILPNRYQEFSVSITPNCLGPADRDTFKLHTDANNHLTITGSSGVAAASGFYHYLKKYCGCHVAWAGSQLNVPSPLPQLSQDEQITSTDRFRYYINTCTHSYTMAFWDWARWEKELDWMAMSGINLPLTFTGQEAVFQQVFMKMGITPEELGKFFGGPAFLAWARMGNIRGWGGPLPQQWIDVQRDLQMKILERARQFGMIPVLPAFGGFVPEGIKRLYPDASIKRTSLWGKFNSTYCCPYMVDPNDPLFVEIGKKFINELTSIYGTDHVYNADTFNENRPETNDTTYIKASGNAVYQGMVQADPKAIWVMQGWLFAHDKFWEPPQAEALLTSVPLGRMVVLDLRAEDQPQYTRFQSFYGQPFIWNMLHNFGGTMAMYGVFQTVNTGPFAARTYPNSTMIGTGLTPEGINQNEVMYEFMNENAFAAEPRDLKSWISDYAKRRYGKTTPSIDSAWQILQRTVYNCTDGHKNKGRQIANWRPTLNELKPYMWYDPKELFSAWKLFLESSEEFKDNHLYRHDLVDITQQSLNLMVLPLFNYIRGNYTALDRVPMVAAGEKMLALIDDIESILATSDHFLLGTWLEDAKKQGSTEEEKALFEYNARIQITLWGPDGNILDYANKVYSGLYSGYYRKRWALFVEVLNISLTTGEGYNQAAFQNACRVEIETPFTKARDLYPTAPIGDTVALSRTLYEKYKPTMESRFFDNFAKYLEAKKRNIKSRTAWNKKKIEMLERKYGKLLTESGQDHLIDEVMDDYVANAIL